jgi:ABC-type glycerol-3-phosphate transport system permease component
MAKKMKNLAILKGDRSFHRVCMIFLTLLFVLILFPCWYIFICSLSSSDAVLKGRVVLWPVELSVASYAMILKTKLLVTGFFNSLLYVSVGTAFAVILLLLAAYPLSRKDFPDRKLITTVFIITMFFSGGLIPSYMLMKNLHLVGSRWAMMLGGVGVTNVIIVRTYFKNSLPPDLLDAAHIDGCRDLYFFFRIALPLSTPVIAVMVLVNAVGGWNSYFSGILYLSRPETFSFQMVLRNLLFASQMPPEITADLNPTALADIQNIIDQIKYSVVVVGAAPMMLLYPFIQRYFIKGMMIGALKD